ncbi:formyltransferase family protein [Nocardia sp. BMG51109]|uniref:formyltransferase family protein n=1 Tax=Nocardia sp. BMG51109 TaxID=1056816 RepID=UPI000466ECB8|nr:formyltransferase family protein [Nocardia sp. BMG51109]
MKIVIAGRGRLAVRGAHLFDLLARVTRDDASLECLVAQGDNGTGGSSDGGRPSLRRAALDNGWPIHENLSEIGSGPSDLLVSLQYPAIVRMPELGGARAVNLHFSLLPRHRGSLTCYWPVIGREKTAGVTLHVMTRGVDEGPIIAARSFPLPEFTSAGAIFEMFQDHAFELLAAHARAVLDGTYAAVPQADPGTAAHRRADVDFGATEITDFARPTAVVRAEILAMVFPGHQLPTVRGRSVRNAYPLPDIGRPGRNPIGAILAETKEVAVVSCADGLLCVEYLGE